MWTFLFFLLIPLALGQDSSCPESTTCTVFSACPWSVELKILKKTDKVEYRKRLAIAKETICNKAKKKVCCRALGDDDSNEVQTDKDNMELYKIDKMELTKWNWKMEMELGSTKLPLVFASTCSVLMLFFFILLLLVKSKVAKLLKQDEVGVSPAYQTTKDIVVDYMDSHPQLKNIAKKMTVEKTSKVANTFFQTMLHNRNIAPLLLNPREKSNLNCAIRFEIKRRLIGHPYDLRGARRCVGLEAEFNQIWAQLDERGNIRQNEEEAEDAMGRIKEKFKGCFGGKISNRMRMLVKTLSLHTFHVLNVVIFSLGVWCMDIFTDGVVLYYFLDLMCLLDRDHRYCPAFLRNVLVANVSLVDTCYDEINHTRYTYDEMNHTRYTYDEINHTRYTYDEMNHTQYNARILAENDSCSAIHGWSVLSRFTPANKIELVSIMAVHNILLLFFFITSLLFALTHNPIKRVYRNIICNLTMALETHEAQDRYISPTVVLTRYRINIDEAGFEAIISMCLQWGNYFNMIYAISVILEHDVHQEEVKDLLNFSNLYISVFNNIFSLTMAQNKAHNTQHRYNMSTKQRVVYFFACFFNTCSFSCLFVCMVTNCLQFCSSMWFNQPLGSPRYIGGFFFVAGICLTIKAGFKSLTSFLHGIIYRSILKGYKQKDILLQKDIVARFFNSAEALQLPTSNTHIESYNSLHSISLLLKLSKQCLGYIFLLFWITGQTLLNYFHFDFHPGVHPHSVYFVYFAMAVIPAGWILSYICLWIYFRLDNGFFRDAHLHYVYGNYVNISSFKNVRKASKWKKLHSQVLEKDSGLSGQKMIIEDGNGWPVGCCLEEGLQCQQVCDVKMELDTTGYWQDLGPQFNLI